MILSQCVDVSVTISKVMELSIELVKLLLDAIAKLEAENKKLKNQLTAIQSVNKVDGDGC